MAEPTHSRDRSDKKAGEKSMDRETMTTVKTIETVAQHAYLKMAELIDGGHLEEARQVAEILKEVGVV